MLRFKPLGIGISRITISLFAAIVRIQTLRNKVVICRDIIALQSISKRYSFITLTDYTTGVSLIFVLSRVTDPIVSTDIEGSSNEIFQMADSLCLCEG